MSDPIRDEQQRRYPENPLPPQELTKPGDESALKPRPHYHGEFYRAADKLKGKVALITGGDSGIGRAVAVHFAREGAKVAIVHLPQEKDDAQETLAAVREYGGEAIAIAGDVTDFGFCKQAVEQVLEHFGDLNILVNNAAYQQHRDEVKELSLEQWDHTLRTNVYGYFYMVKVAVPHLKAGDTIINTGSITGLEGSARLLDYSATKGAIHAFTKSLASNLIKRGIRVNCVAPGPVWTPLNPAERSAEEVAHFGEGTPLGRPAQPEEIAPAYVYFASNADSSFVNGEVLTLLGGSPRAG